MELLTTIAIIAVLAVLLFSALPAVLDATKSVKNISNLRTIGTASLNYAADHNGDLPRDGILPGEWQTFGYGVQSQYGTARYLYGKSAPFGMADPAYVANVDVFYSPFATAFKNREPGKLFMVGANTAYIGYLSYCLPRIPAPRAGIPDLPILPGVHNDTIRESTNAPLYSDFWGFCKPVAEFKYSKCAVVYLGGHVRVFNQSDLEKESWTQAVEYFATH